MSRSEVRTCDSCTSAIPDTARSFVAMTREGVPGLAIMKAADAEAIDIDPAIHFDDLCGHACAQTRLSQFLDSLSS